MLPYKRPADCLFITYTLTSKMLPGEAFLFWRAREALLLAPTTSCGLVVYYHSPEQIDSFVARAEEGG